MLLSTCGDHVPWGPDYPQVKPVESPAGLSSQRCIFGCVQRLDMMCFVRSCPVIVQLGCISKNPVFLAGPSRDSDAASCHR